MKAISVEMNGTNKPLQHFCFHAMFKIIIAYEIIIPIHYSFIVWGKKLYISLYSVVIKKRWSSLEEILER